MYKEKFKDCLSVKTNNDREYICRNINISLLLNFYAGYTNGSTYTTITKRIGKYRRPDHFQYSYFQNGKFNTVKMIATLCTTHIDDIDGDENIIEYYMLTFKCRYGMSIYPKDIIIYSLDENNKIYKYKTFNIFEEIDKVISFIISVKEYYELGIEINRIII